MWSDNDDDKDDEETRKRRLESVEVEEAAVIPAVAHEPRYDDNHGAFIVSIRHLVWAVAALLVASHVCYLSQYLVPNTNNNNNNNNNCVVQRIQYSIPANTTTIDILEKPTHHISSHKKKKDDSFFRDSLGQDDVFETLECSSNSSGNASFWISDYYANDFVRVMYPTTGFVSRSNLITIDQQQQQQNSIMETPPNSLLFRGWYPISNETTSSTRERQYLYAPTLLLLAQSLWNAMQILQLYLLLALWYNLKRFQQTTTTTKYSLNTFRILMALTICLLPLSVYVISPGGHLFATITVMTVILSRKVVNNYKAKIAAAVQEGDNNNNNSTSVRHNNNSSSSCSWRLVKEETLACVANLCCHMYNGRKPWGDIYAFFDQALGWKTKGDVTPSGAFTLLMPSVRIPLFVSRASHSSTHARVFLVLWSFLPFLYTTYFGILYMLAHRSPGVRLQRAFCLFGMINFLFATDMVAYKYGRGYRSPYENYFHWYEHFAWRMAIVLPIYQNCTNGHWTGLLKWAATIYGIWFVIFQVLQCDVFRFITFLVYGEERSLFEWMGWQDNVLVVLLNLNTPKTWVTLIMSVLFFGLHFSPKYKHKLFRVSIHSNSASMVYERLSQRESDCDFDDDNDDCAGLEIS